MKRTASSKKNTAWSGSGLVGSLKFKFGSTLNGDVAPCDTPDIASGEKSFGPGHEAGREGKQKNALERFCGAGRVFAHAKWL